MASSVQSVNKRPVQIRVPKVDHNIDERIWIDLEEYLFTGFLSNHANIFGQNFVFKSLNHQELRLINYLKSDDNSIFKASFIAYSLFIAMGQNILCNRSTNISNLTELVQKFEPILQDKIIDNLNLLNKKASRLFPLVEVYVHEPRSRFRWLHIKKSLINSPDITGIPGTNEIGLNYCQENWIALNELLDKKEANEVDWNHSKFIGSCFAGKGVISIDEQDKTRRNREKQDISDNKARVVSEYLGYIHSGDEVVLSENTTVLPDGRTAVVESRFSAETTEELAEQLSASLSGEKDFHDQVVLNQYNKIRAEKDQEDEHRKELSLTVKESLEGEIIASGSKVLRSKKDVDAYISRMHELMLKPNLQQVNRDVMNSDDIDRSGFRKR